MAVVKNEDITYSTDYFSDALKYFVDVYVKEASEIVKNNRGRMSYSEFENKTLESISSSLEIDKAFVRNLQNILNWPLFLKNRFFSNDESYFDLLGWFKSKRFISRDFDIVLKKDYTSDDLEKMSSLILDCHKEELFSKINSFYHNDLKDYEPRKIIPKKIKEEDFSVEDLDVEGFAMKFVNGFKKIVEPKLNIHYNGIDIDRRSNYTDIEKFRSSMESYMNEFSIDMLIFKRPINLDYQGIDLDTYANDTILERFRDDVESFMNEFLIDNLVLKRPLRIDYDGIVLHGYSDLVFLEKVRSSMENYMKKIGLDKLVLAFPELQLNLHSYREEFPDDECYQHVDLGWFIENT